MVYVLARVWWMRRGPSRSLLLGIPAMHTTGVVFCVRPAPKFQAPIDTHALGNK